MNYHELKAIRIDDNEVATHFKRWIEPYQQEAMTIRLNQETGALLIDIEETPRHQKEAYIRRMIELGMTVHIQFHSHKQNYLTLPLMIDKIDDPTLIHRETETTNYISLEDGVTQVRLSPPSPFVLKMWFGELGTQLLNKLSNELTTDAKNDAIRDFVDFCDTLIGIELNQATDRIIKHFNKGNRSTKKRMHSTHSATILFFAYQEENKDWNWKHIGSGTSFAILHILMLLFIALPFKDEMKRKILNNIPKKGFELSVFEALLEEAKMKGGQ